MVTCKRYAAFLALVLPFAFAMPSGVEAQQAAGPEVTDERLSTYARAFVEIARVRDDVHAQLAQARNKTTEAQEHLREQMRERVAKVIQDHGMTEQEYSWITYVISSNEDRREAFDRILAEVSTDL